MRRTIPLVLTLAVALPPALPGAARAAQPAWPLPYRLAAQEQTEDSWPIQGVLEERGADYVVVYGRRFETAPTVRVLGKDGRPISSGMAALVPGVEVRLTRQNSVVVQIQLVDLLK